MLTSPLDCYAITHPGVEHITAAELAALGIVPGANEPGGVAFQTDVAGLYAANLHLRTASRVLLRIASFHAHSFAELERHARKVPWSNFVAPGAPVDFSVASRKSKLYHQKAIAQRLLEAAGENQPSSRPAAEPPFFARLHRDTCTLSADTSGALLHRRGYRLDSAKAPLRETLAAAMLMGAAWDGSVPLLDPMCGSGTIAIEAALLARRIAPGLGREFAFEQWPVFDRAVWDRVRGAARSAIRPDAGVPILASDRDPGAILATANNAKRAGVDNNLTLRQCAFSAIEPPELPGLLITNPPYGIRVGERLRLRNLYAQLGNVARTRLTGWEVAILSSHPDLERQVGLPFETRFDTSNGGLPVRLRVARVDCQLSC